MPGLEQDPTETPSTATSSSAASDRLSCDFLSPWPGCPKTHDEPGRLAAAEELGLVGQAPRADMQKYIELCKDIFQVGSQGVVPWQQCNPALSADMGLARLSLQPSSRGLRWASRDIWATWLQQLTGESTLLTAPSCRQLG